MGQYGGMFSLVSGRESIRPSEEDEGRDKSKLPCGCRVSSTQIEYVIFQGLKVQAKRGEVYTNATGPFPGNMCTRCGNIF